MENNSKDINKLSAELWQWCNANKLPQMSADDILYGSLGEELTPEQRQWLVDFCERWDRVIA